MLSELKANNVLYILLTLYLEPEDLQIDPFNMGKLGFWYNPITPEAWT